MKYFKMISLISIVLFCFWPQLAQSVEFKHRYNSYWLHGNAVKASDSKKCKVIPSASGSDIKLTTGPTLQWVHIPMTSPPWIESTRSILKECYLLFDAQDSEIVKIEFWDGNRKIEEVDLTGHPLSGPHEVVGPENTFTMFAGTGSALNIAILIKFFTDAFDPYVHLIGAGAVFERSWFDFY